MPEHAENSQKILDEYDANLGLYENYRISCEALFRQLLRMESLRVHSVSSRIKERSHLAEKLSRFGKDYGVLSDVTDVVGIRVITHFEDDVDRIAAVVMREFRTDPNKSVDKRKALDPDRFGYMSLHFVCGMREDRARLAEYGQFAGIACEIQVRSILQHAWAEIEHDLGYKTGAPIPAPIRRRFSRLAGLLGIGDSEFRLIRDDLAAYTEQVTQDIRQRPESVGLDDVSLKAFVISDETSVLLDKEIAAHLGATLAEQPWFQMLAEMMQYTGIQTIEELRNALERRKEFILKQYQVRVQKGTYATVSLGISIFHLFEVLMAERGDSKEMQKAFEKFHVGSDPQVAALEVLSEIQAAR